MAESQQDTAHKRQKMSKVWDHFKLKKEDRKVQCVHCNAELAFHNSTSAMMQHLLRRHLLNIGSSNFADTSTSQQPLDYILGLAPSRPVDEAAVLTESILKMLVADMRPLSMVEDEGFKKMISAFNPKYMMPGRPHFTSLMENKRQQMMEKLKTVLQDAPCVALTTDIWTSVGTERYLRVACHFLGQDWEMKSFSLTIMSIKESHAAANIADCLEEITDKFHIPFQKVKAVVHDNGSDVAAAAAAILKERHGWASLRCSGHILNVAVQSALQNSRSVAACVASARNLVEHFKKSELACGKLQEMQQQMGMPPLMLIRDTSTRWNGTYHMLSRLVGQRWPVAAALSDPAVHSSGRLHSLDLKPEQWNLSEELTRVLGPFVSVAEFLRGEQYVTLSSLPQLVHNLKRATLSSAFETAPVKEFQAQVVQQIEERLQEVFLFQPEAANTVLLATALDPRFRNLKFLPAEDVLKVQSAIQSMALAVEKEERQSGSEAAAESGGRLAPKDRTFANTILGSSSDSDASDEEDEGEQLSQAVRKEVLRYFGELPLSKKDNPLLWWRRNATQYPTLAKLAKCFLGIPATLAPSERLFSATGNIVSPRRASLISEHVDMLTFLHCNHGLL
ncbi:E3 SUMO-protein ligase ZBED1-like [Festucalex cinctus]